ncbi:MAG: glutamate synthase subunit beta [Acidimicrobiia bacterium]|nr:glutamate synthase subunit beta [Acidimicrobiia bacterium]
MGEATGFLKWGRTTPTRRAVEVRLNDWREVYEPFSRDELTLQAGRCMDCGIPFCNNGCPLGNLIPDWNDLVYRDHWREAIERLHATNNFPEFTGRLCPAPCEASCVLGINQDPVTIKQVEVEIVDRAFAEGWIEPVVSEVKTGKRVAVVGSGPAGLAAAQQLTRAGHDVTVFERADRIGGLLRYGIPEFKLEKRHVDRRLEQMKAEGTTFRANSNVGAAGEGGVPLTELREFDATVLAGGATAWRDLPIPGRELGGIHQAMEFLPIGNRVQQGDLAEPTITAAGKRVVIIGGGDTGADCLGTAHRQGAESVHQFEILPRPPDTRAPTNPWPTWSNVFRVSSAHEEGGERVYSVNTERFEGDERGNVRALLAHEVEMVDGRFEKIEGTDFELPCELVLLAMGFVGPDRAGLLDDLGVDLDERGNVARDATFMTSEPGVFACGDMGRGQSLIVWAIAEGRSCAAGVDRYLTGETDLPAPIAPTARPLL